MKIATARDMQEVDRRTIGHYGIPGPVLMERAGTAVAKRAMDLLPGRKALVLSGTGNNGGDGFVAARELFNQGVAARVLVLGRRERMSPDCKAQFNTAKKMGIPVEFRPKPSPRDVHGALVIDAILGTGLGKEVKGPMAGAILAVNNSGAPVLSVDIPSGISSDTGQVMGTAIRATQTVTFGLPKRGHFLYPGAEYTGELFVEDIGFPRELFQKIDCSLITKELMSPLVPQREAYSHKGDYGHVLLLGGSTGKTGAALMAARACLKAGAGLVSIGIPETLASSIMPSVLEEMLLPLPDDGDGTLSAGALDAVLDFLDTRAGVLAIGPGIGTGEGTAKLVRELIKRCSAPMVVDADGINALGGRPSLLRGARAPVVLTPHPGEFSRLSGKGVAEIEADRPGAATVLSKQTQAYVVLKGAPTVVALPEGGLFINSTGNPGMAKAGSGDVLTGIIAALLAQGTAPAEACTLGVYLHGLSGDMAAADLGMHSLLASDIISSLPDAIMYAKEGEKEGWEG